MLLELYTRSNCAVCDSVKDALRYNKIPFTEHVIGETILREKVVDLFDLGTAGDVRLPLVTVDGTWIGGRDEVLKMIANGKI